MGQGVSRFCKISYRGNGNKKLYGRVAMEEKELKLKAMEITRDIVVAAISSGKFDIPAETKYSSAGVSITKKENIAIQILIEDVFSTVYSALAK
jgi:hypothetical protein